MSSKYRYPPDATEMRFEVGSGIIAMSAAMPAGVAARAVGIDSAAVSQAFERIERVLNDVAARRTGELRNETRSTGIVVRMAPVGVLAPTSLLPLVAQRHKSLKNICH